MWDQLGQRLSTRQRMEHDLASLEEAQLEDAEAELEERRGARTRPSGLGLAFNTPGATDYFRRQGTDSDAAFLRSMLKTGDRPRVRVGEAEVVGGSRRQGGGVQGGPFATRNKYAGGSRGGTTDESVVTDDDVADIQALLLEYRLRQQGF